MSETHKDQEFVEYVVKELVDNPDKVVITRTVDDRGVLLELSVDPSDMGKIIGKAGATAKSIRTLLRVLGAKDDARYNLKISEPEGSERHNPDTADKDSSDTSTDDVESSSDSSPVEQNDDQDSADETDSKVADIKAKAREGIEDLDTDI
jgi:predicted RNA-binding protein YlqC (UPF0109 family)